MTGKKPIALEDRQVNGARLSSPSAGRNKEVIRDTVLPYIEPNSRILEIASGTGEHGHTICSRRSDIIWQCSDIDQSSRNSQTSWAMDFPNQMPRSLKIDVTSDPWWDEIGQFNIIFCANMVHIAPWSAALGLASGAGQILGPQGLVILYGPFLEGEETAPSNLEFDRVLKARNSDWGVRSLDSVKHIFADVGFNLAARIVMPKENRILVFKKSL